MKSPNPQSATPLHGEGRRFKSCTVQPNPLSDLKAVFSEETFTSEKTAFSFGDVLLECAANDEFVRGFDRLTRSNLSSIGRGPAIIQAIDEATGYTRNSLLKFCTFVFETVWLRLPEARR